jgi:hypothetical protein
VPPSPPAATTTWFARGPDGTPHVVTLVVGLPTRQRGGHWSAPVTLAGLEPRTHLISGVDGAQAIQLAIRFVASRLDAFAADGWTFHVTEHGPRVVVDDLLPR